MYSYHRTRHRSAVARAKAFAAATSLGDTFGVRFSLSGWNTAARQSYLRQWPDPQFDWIEIFRRHREPDRLDVAMWVDGRLCGLGLATTTASAVNLLFLEGEPRNDSPLAGLRIPIFLDTSAHYAQQLGRSELRVWPLSASLGRLYQDAYGFSLVTAGTNAPYWRKDL